MTVKYQPRRGLGRLLNLLVLKGSVYPIAVLGAIPATVLAAMIDNERLVEYAKRFVSWPPAATLDNSIWTGFTFVVGFSVVFRVSQAYSRFWAGTNAVYQMQEIWLQVASSLCAFSKGGKCEPVTAGIFKHILVRLFSVLHAMAISEIEQCSVERRRNGSIPAFDMEIVDGRGLDLKSWANLKRSHCKADLVSQWIMSHCVEYGSLEALPAGAALATSFKDIRLGMSKLQEARTIAEIPFPFPYAQTCDCLLALHYVLCPVVSTMFASSRGWAAAFTFLQVFAFWSLTVLAVRLENPFGSDFSDIDFAALQKKMNYSLLSLIHPDTQDTPRLSMEALLDNRRLSGRSAPLMPSTYSHLTQMGMGADEKGTQDECWEAGKVYTSEDLEKGLLQKAEADDNFLASCAYSIRRRAELEFKRNVDLRRELDRRVQEQEQKEIEQEQREEARLQREADHRYRQEELRYREEEKQRRQEEQWLLDQERQIRAKLHEDELKHREYENSLREEEYRLRKEAQKLLEDERKQKEEEKRQEEEKKREEEKKQAEENQQGEKEKLSTFSPEKSQDVPSMSSRILCNQPVPLPALPALPPRRQTFAPPKKPSPQEGQREAQAKHSIDIVGSYSSQSQETPQDELHSSLPHNSSAPREPSTPKAAIAAAATGDPSPQRPEGFAFPGQLPVSPASSLQGISHLSGFGASPVVAQSPSLTLGASHFLSPTPVKAVSFAQRRGGSPPKGSALNAPFGTSDVEIIEGPPQPPLTTLLRTAAASDTALAAPWSASARAQAQAPAPAQAPAHTQAHAPAPALDTDTEWSLRLPGPADASTASAPPPGPTATTIAAALIAATAPVTRADAPVPPPAPPPPTQPPSDSMKSLLLQNPVSPSEHQQDLHQESCFPQWPAVSEQPHSAQLSQPLQMSVQPGPMQPPVQSSNHQVQGTALPFASLQAHSN
eukprot:TRINITY_DN6206_c1_g1_i1.p1 TRINITY_DN6206_c1_g1~~TRINITY_DN6206_c1_g1_i1.p1  ORF type:complete len:966 (-),score=167.39 TRINITY_DN6206_c1_g1_i1:174-3011(-)